MIETIIGGAIAAVIGAISGLTIAVLMEWRHDRARRFLIVDELIAETQANLVIAKHPVARSMWWMVPYKLETYQAYKGQIFFLPKDIRVNLAALAFLLEGVNTGIRVHQLRAAFGQPVIEKPIETPADILDKMGFCDRELRNWRKQDKSKEN